MENHTPSALKNARRLRQEMSLPEVLLWQQLKGKPSGVKFRKQHPFGNLVLDFFCAEKRIAIEIDGIAHDMGDRPQRDLARDKWLSSQNVHVLRIPASLVLKDAVAAAESVLAYCVAYSPPPSAAGAAATSPSGGGLYGATC
jgi:very-short-patch-repair endonuclease